MGNLQTAECKNYEVIEASPQISNQVLKVRQQYVTELEFLAGANEGAMNEGA